MSALNYLGWLTAAVCASADPRAAPIVSNAAEELAQLRADCERALATGDVPARFTELSDRIRRFVGGVVHAGDKLSALKLAGRLCFEGPLKEADPLREFALRELARLGPASPRARVMLSTQFFPPLHRAAPGDQAQALRRYDALIDRIASSATDPATLCDLRFLKCAVRIEVHRAWDAAWLDAAERARIDSGLAAIANTDVEAPTGGLYRDVAPPLRRELRETAFGRSVADFTASALGGEKVRLADYQGKVVVLSFWSTWCIPCLELVPHEADFIKRLEARGVALLGVNSDPTLEQARRTARDREMTWPQLWSPPASEDGLAHRLCVRQWPSVIVLDRNGAIRAKFVGSTFQDRWKMSDVERAVLELIEEK